MTYPSPIMILISLEFAPRTELPFSAVAVFISVSFNLLPLVQLSPGLVSESLELEIVDTH